MKKEDWWYKIQDEFTKWGLLERGKEKWGKTLTPKEYDKAIKWLNKKITSKASKTVLPMEYSQFGLDWLEKWNYGTSIKPNWVFHPGVDFNKGAGSDDLGLPILSIADGVVLYVGIATGWGWHIHIQHNINHKKYGKIICNSHYAHLQFRPSLTVGEKVIVGQKIGKCGSTGTQSPHLHFEIQKGYLGANFFPNGRSKDWVANQYYNPHDFLNF